MFDNLSEKFSDAFKAIQGKGKITEANIEETLKAVKSALLEADVHFKVVKNFIQKIKEEALGEKVLSGVNPGEQFVKVVHDQLTSLMGEENTGIEQKSSPQPILIVGLNGAGKTTFSGKLALFLRNKNNKKALLVPADNFRPAAKKQLETLAKNIDVPIFDSDLSLMPAEIAKRGYEAAKEQGMDYVIIDTAGRLQVDDELMGQLADVKKQMDPLSPEVFFVADAMTGQEAVNVAETFHEKIGLTGVVLSKMDSDARGGAALSIRQVTGVPIKFYSHGEKMKDLDAFHPDRMAKRILDMGDVVTLVEKAKEVIDEKEAEKMMKKMEKNKFTIDDFLKQMNQISKLGSMESLLKMIPGMGGALRQIGDLGPAEEEMTKIKVIIGSMTQKERDDHKLLNTSRKERIAKGSGTRLNDVNEFIQKFEQMQKMMSGMLKGGMPSFPGMPGMGGAMPGAGKQKKKKKGAGRGGWGKGYFK